jgi:hypothetical protein
MKTIYPYFLFLPLTRKIPAYNRHLKRGGIFFRKHELASGKRPHRHKFRIKRMKSCDRTFYNEDRRFDNSVIFKKKSYLQMLKPH